MTALGPAPAAQTAVIAQATAGGNSTNYTLDTREFADKITDTVKVTAAGGVDTTLGLLNTAGTAVELIPAPGAGKILVVDSFVYKLTFNTTVYNFTNGTGGQDNTLVIGLLLRNNAAVAGQKWENGLFFPTTNFSYTQTTTSGGIVGGGMSTTTISPAGSLLENTAYSIATRYDNTTVTQGDSNVIFSFVYRTIDSTTLL